MSQVKKLEELLKKLEVSRNEVTKMAEGGFLGLTKYGSGVKKPVGASAKPRGRPRLSGGAFLGTKADTMGENYGRVGFQAPVEKLGRKAVKIADDMEGGYMSGGYMSGGYMSGGVLSGGVLSGGADCGCGGARGGRRGGARGGDLSGGDYSGTVGGAVPGMMGGMVGGMVGGKCGVCGYKKCRCVGSSYGGAKKKTTNPWLLHLAKVRKANPHLKSDVVALSKLAKESY